jgi:MMP 1-O-methyltransferase
MAVLHSGTRAAGRREELAALRRSLQGVGGWLSDEEAETLYTLARRCSGRGLIVEIGSNQGRSTICLGLGSRAGAGVQVHAVDPRKGPLLERYNENLAAAGVDDMVITHCMTSADAAKRIPQEEPIELLFIDGSHKEDMVRLDWRLWAHRVIDGGWIAMHDTTGFVGPKRVADEEIYRSGRFRDVAFVYPTLTVGRRASATSQRDRLRARYALALKHGFETLIRVRGRIPAPAKSAGRALLRRIG